ncbi:MAG TPA: flavodoxin family protein [Chthonomonadales bacterium]|nr:flavodoxin family protein [Chthonomonadales bacterium]
MPRVLILSSTPRTEGNSHLLAERVAETAREGGASVELIRLAGLRIDPCDACDACLASASAECVLSDDMSDLYPRILAADALVFASPIYFFCMNAPLKALLDRLYALGSHEAWDALAGKRVGLIFTYGDADPLASGVVNAVNVFRDACRFLRMELVECVHASCGGAGAVRSDTRAIEAAAELGRRLATAA